MFSKLKEKINTKKRNMKKAAFLAIIAYVYDKITNRKKIDKKEYLEDVEYKVEEKKNDNLK